MTIKHLFMLAMVVLLGLRAAAGEVVFVASFDKGLDADRSAASRTALAHDGATANGVLDLSAGGVEYETPLRDLSRGTIEFWIKPAFDLNKTADHPEKSWEEHNFLWIPAAGGGVNGISLGWYNRFGPLFNFRIYDGATEAMIGLSPGNPHFKDFDPKAGVWHYVVATWNERRVRLFIDGKLIAEKSVDKPFRLQPIDEPMMLGAFNTSRDLQLRPANALLDDLRISDQELPDGQKEIAVPRTEPTR